MNRRAFLTATGATALTAAFLSTRGTAASPAGDKRWTLSEAEWRKRLPPQRYAILREEATERAFTSPLDKEKRAGTFACAGCALPLYSSKAKFESGTGWPSFWAALPKAVATKTDYKIGLPRTEVHCRRCGGHLGHIFNDGPRPTGKRHCINGLALVFRAA